MDLYEILQQKGYIGYGKVLHISLLEELIGHKFEEGWPFLGPYFQLKERLEEEGYFATSRQQYNNSLYILSVKDMHLKNDKNIKKAFDKSKKSVNTMKKADYHQLDIDDLEKHLHSLNKAINVLNSAKSAISKYI